MKNAELFLPGMKNPIHFDPNNTFLEVKLVYENSDDIKQMQFI